VYVEQVQQMILQRKSHMGIVISDHNYQALLQIADEVLLLSDGYVHLVREQSDLVRYGYCREV
jgi:ABC-type lipopolysaccharide export system ATPase subunit